MSFYSFPETYRRYSFKVMFGLHVPANLPADWPWYVASSGRDIFSETPRWTSHIVFYAPVWVTVSDYWPTVNTWTEGKDYTEIPEDEREQLGAWAYTQQHRKEQFLKTATLRQLRAHGKANKLPLYGSKALKDVWQLRTYIEWQEEYKLEFGSYRKFKNIAEFWEVYNFEMEMEAEVERQAALPTPEPITIQDEQDDEPTPPAPPSPAPRHTMKRAERGQMTLALIWCVGSLLVFSAIWCVFKLSDLVEVARTHLEGWVDESLPAPQELVELVAMALEAEL